MGPHRRLGAENPGLPANRECIHALISITCHSNASTACFFWTENVDMIDSNTTNGLEHFASNKAVSRPILGAGGSDIARDAQISEAC